MGQILAFGEFYRNRYRTFFCDIDDIECLHGKDSESWIFVPYHSKIFILIYLLESGKVKKIFLFPIRRNGKLHYRSCIRLIRERTEIGDIFYDADQDDLLIT